MCALLPLCSEIYEAGCSMLHAACRLKRPILLLETGLAVPLLHFHCSLRGGWQVPDVLAPVAGALTPLVETILRNDMQRFAKFAVSRSPSAAL